jgi:hypothetical protein
MTSTIFQQGLFQPAHFAARPSGPKEGQTLLTEEFGTISKDSKQPHIATSSSGPRQQAHGVIASLLTVPELV